MDDARQRLIFEIIEDMSLVRRTMMTNRQGFPPEHHLPSAQAELLFIVSQHEGLSVKEIADIMRVTGSAVTQHVEALVKAGMLARESDPSDRRACRVRLSEQGAERFKKFKYRFLEKVANFLSPLTDEELSIFRDLFLKILQAHRASTETERQPYDKRHRTTRAQEDL